MSSKSIQTKAIYNGVSGFAVKVFIFFQELSEHMLDISIENNYLNFKISCSKEIEEQLYCIHI